MIKKNKEKRLLAIILYIVPIVITIMITKTLAYFLLCTGVMTILLGLSMILIPTYIGFNKETDKYNSPIFISLSGVLLTIVAIM